jgi:hypothetical protein
MIITASTNGCALNTNINSGGGTDDTVALQTLIDTINADYIANGTPGTLILDGYARLSKNPNNAAPAGLVLKSGVTIDATNGGVFLTANSNCAMLTSVLTGQTISNYDIGIIGGIWNGNGLHQDRWENANSDSPNMWVTGIWLGSTQGLILGGTITIKNSKTFALVLSHIYGGGAANTGHNLITYWDDVTPGYNNQDGIHFWGTIEGFIFDSLTSNGDDDVLGLNTTENITYGDTRRGSTGGHIQDVTIKQLVFGYNGVYPLRGLRLGDAGNEDQTENWLQDITIKNVTGGIGQTYGSNADIWQTYGAVPLNLYIMASYNDSNGSMGDFYVENVYIH